MIQTKLKFLYKHCTLAAEISLVLAVLLGLTFAFEQLATPLYTQSIYMLYKGLLFLGLVVTALVAGVMSFHKALFENV